MLAALVALYLSHSTDVTGQILRQFRTHRIVALGEAHQNIEHHRFFRQLIADPRFREVVDDVVVECGNPLYQDIVDRFERGEQVPWTELSKVWRNTTQWLVWDAPVYEQLLTAVRSVNAGRTKKIRVLLADSPVDWAKIQKGDDFRPFASRDPDWFKVIDREVTQKKRHALLICGSAHIGKGKMPFGRGGVVAQLLETKFPGQTYSIYLADGDSPVSEVRKHKRFPELIDLHRSALGKKSFGVFLPKNLVFFKMVDGKRVETPVRKTRIPPAREMVDALLFVAPTSEISVPRQGYYDSAYVAELRRRAPILSEVFGFDANGALDEALKPGG